VNASPVCVESTHIALPRLDVLSQTKIARRRLSTRVRSRADRSVTGAGAVKCVDSTHVCWSESDTCAITASMLALNTNERRFPDVAIRAFCLLPIRSYLLRQFESHRSQQESVRAPDTWQRHVREAPANRNSDPYRRSDEAALRQGSYSARRNLRYESHRHVSTQSESVRRCRSDY
jgi:hypothetical protein